MLLAPTLVVLLALPTADADKTRDLPVTELTAFKDGHALVVREGPRDVVDGSVLLDGLPAPLLGTFWPFTNDGNDVVSATASQIPVPGSRVIASIEELLEENVGRTVELYAHHGESKMTVGELVAISSDGNPRQVLIRSDETLLSFPMNTIFRVAFPGGATYEVDAEKTNPGLRLKLKNPNMTTADVGLMYVQKGFRWIPQYRMTLGPNGTAKYVLRATLVNDLVDLDDTTVRLVVGVPTFAFAGQTDPISLQSVAENIYTNAAGGRFGRRFDNRMQLSNAYGVYDSNGNLPEPENSGPEVTKATRSEDLFVFTVENVTLKTGERMTIEVAQGEVEYEHRFHVDLPVLPPREINTSGVQQQQDLVAKLLKRPQVAHRLAIHNNSRTPLTTAPSLLFTVDDDGHETLLAQAMQTYTAPGGDSRVDLGTAIEINVQFEEEEVGRDSAATRHGGKTFDRVNLLGKVTICNHRPENSRLTVRRYVPGPLDSVTSDGTTKTLAPYDDDAGTAGLSGGNVTANWWYGYRPNWYSALNPVSRAEWTFDLTPNEIVTPEYEWHYFWRW